MTREYTLPFEGTEMYCYEAGSGYPILMLHGSGPGTATMSNWPDVMGPLAERFHILAIDFIGYGKSGRKPEKPYFDMQMWVRQTREALRHLAPSGPVGIIAHSLGGSVALSTALEEPRVNKLFLQGSLGGQARMNDAMEAGWTFPKDEDDYRRFYKSVIRVDRELSDEFIRERFAVMNANEYGRYFSEMYAGDKQNQLNQTLIAPGRLAGLTCDITLLYGAEDTCIPFNEGALALADALPHADLIRLAGCGHPCSFHKPEKFLAQALAFFG